MTVEVVINSPEVSIILPEGMTEADLVITQERGQLVHHIRDTLVRLQGPEAWSHLLAAVSDPCRKAFEGHIGLFEWVDAGMATELSRAFYAASADELTYQRGRDAARNQLTTVNRWVLRFLSPSFLLSTVPRFFQFYLKGGHVQVEHAGGNTATVHVWAIGLYDEYWRFGATGWLEEALEMTGCRGCGPATRSRPDRAWRPITIAIT